MSAARIKITRLLGAAMVALAVVPWLGMSPAGAAVVPPPPPDTQDTRATQVNGNATECNTGQNPAGLPGQDITSHVSSSSDGTLLDITAVEPGYTVTGVVVKGAQDFNRYLRAALGDLPWLDLRAPLKNGKDPGISHWFVCGTFTPPQTQSPTPSTSTATVTQTQTVTNTTTVPTTQTVTNTTTVPTTQTVTNTTTVPTTQTVTNTTTVPTTQTVTNTTTVPTTATVTNTTTVPTTATVTNTTTVPTTATVTNTTTVPTTQTVTATVTETVTNTATQTTTATQTQTQTTSVPVTTTATQTTSVPVTTTVTVTQTVTGGTSVLPTKIGNSTVPDDDDDTGVLGTKTGVLADTGLDLPMGAALGLSFALLLAGGSLMALPGRMAVERKRRH